MNVSVSHFVCLQLLYEDETSPRTAERDAILAFDNDVFSTPRIKKSGAVCFRVNSVEVMTPASVAKLPVTKNLVDHPDHYGGEENPYEVIKVLEDWLTPEEFIGAMKFNIHKYLARAGKKDGTQDFEKATWYAGRLSDFTKRMEGKSND